MGIEHLGHMQSVFLAREGAHPRFEEVYHLLTLTWNSLKTWQGANFWCMLRMQWGSDGWNRLDERRLGAEEGLLGWWWRQGGGLENIHICRIISLIIAIKIKMLTNTLAKEVQPTHPLHFKDIFSQRFTQVLSDRLVNCPSSGGYTYQLTWI